jgi:uncharacterized protein (DUF488 family)
MILSWFRPRCRQLAQKSPECRDRQLGTFLWLLQKHQIEALVDVRRYPASRRHPHFSRENLSVALEDEDIEYHWLEALGGNRKRANDAPPSPNRGIEDEAFRNYADHMATDEFRKGVAKLTEIAGGHRTVIMCAEGDYRHCHRRLLSDHLVANDVAVQHILPSGEVEPPKLTAGAKIVDGHVTYPGQPTLFDLDGE